MPTRIFGAAGGGGRDAGRDAVRSIHLSPSQDKRRGRYSRPNSLLAIFEIVINREDRDRANKTARDEYRSSVSAVYRGARKHERRTRAKKRAEKERGRESKRRNAASMTRDRLKLMLEFRAAFRTLTLPASQRGGERERKGNRRRNARVIPPRLCLKTLQKYRLSDRFPISASHIHSRAVRAHALRVNVPSRVAFISVVRSASRRFAVPLSEHAPRKIASLSLPPSVFVRNHS